MPIEDLAEPAKHVTTKRNDAVAYQQSICVAPRILRRLQGERRAIKERKAQLARAFAKHQYF